MSSKYYAELGLEFGASNDEVKKAYRKLAKIYHPDRTVNLDPSERMKREEKFKKISLAYQKLTSGDEEMDMPNIIIASMDNINDKIFMEAILPMIFTNTPGANNMFFNIFNNMSSYISDMYDTGGQNIILPTRLEYKSDKYNVYLCNNDLMLEVAYRYESFVRHKIKKINIKIFGEVILLKVRLNRNNFSANVIKKKKMIKLPIDKITLLHHQHHISQIQNIRALIFCK